MAKSYLAYMEGFMYEMKDNALHIFSDNRSDYDNGDFNLNFKRNSCKNLDLDKESQKVIRKYLPLEILLKWIENQTLYMDKAISWDDKYELPFLKSKIKGKNPPRDFCNEHLIATIYAQSWSLESESYEMWKTFCPHEKVYVCVETTILELANVVTVNKISGNDVLLGKVSYYSERGLVKKLRQCRLGYSDMDLYQKFFPETMFWKRRFFKSEAELRVVKILDTGTAEKYSYPDRICFGFGSNRFIKKVIFAPDTSQKDYYQGLAYLHRCGIDERKIQLSEIYGHPVASITIMPSNS